MALDGFTIRSLGLPEDKTSAQLAASTEQHIQLGKKLKGVETIDGSGTNRAITLEDDKEKNKGKEKRKKRNNSGQAQEENVQETSTEEAFTVEAKTEPPSKSLDFYTKFSNRLAIRFNKNKEIVELYDKDTKKTIESITANDLVKLVDKLDISSGILVNRKI